MSEAIINVGKLTGLCVWKSGEWVKWDGVIPGIKNVQRATAEMSATVKTLNVTISAVDLAKTFLNFSYSQRRDNNTEVPRGRLTTSTNIEFWRFDSVEITYIAWEVVEFS